MSGFRWTLAVLLSHWRRRPGQLAALMAGLALATALWSGVQALNLAARDSYDRAARLLGGAATVTIARPEGGVFDQRLWIDLRRAGWPVSPVLEGRVRLEGQTLRLIGVEPVTLPPGGAVAVIGAPEGGDAQRLIAPPRATLAAPQTLRDLGLAAGDAPRAPGGALPPLLAREGMAGGVLVVDIGVAQAVLGQPGAVSRLLAPAGHGRDPAALAALTAGMLAQLEDSPDGDLARLTDSFHLNLTAFGFLAFVVGLFIAHAAIGLAFEQRLPMLRTLRACGAPVRAVALALLAEMAGFALVAGSLGMLGGWLIAAALAPDVAASLRGLYGAPVSGGLSMSPWWWLSGLGMTLLGAGAAAGAGVWRAARLPVLAPAMPQAWLAAHRARLRWQGLAAVALLALAAGLAALGDGLAAGFGLLAALLLGAALGAPVALNAALRLAAARAKAPVTRWLWADAQAASGGLSLALMALLLALAANIGVGTMVGGFRATFTGWLDQRLAAEVYVRGPDAAMDGLAARALATPQVLAALPSRSAEARLGGWPVEVLGLADDATYRDRWPLMAAAPDVWARLAAGEGALVSEQLARRLGLGVGDPLRLPAADGPWSLTVAGTYPDYGNPKGQVVVNFDAHLARWPQAARGSWALRTEPGAAGAVIAALAADPALAQAEFIDQAGVKRLSLSLFDKTFAVTAALNALTLAVAGAALLASLTTLSSMRLPQLAPLWAMGVTRARLARLELLKMLALAALIAALAVPVGVALAWVLVAVVNVQAFGWRLPLHLFPLQWLAMGGLALLTAALASALPLWRLARTPPARLAQAFSHER